MRALLILVLVIFGIGGAMLSRFIGLIMYVWFSLFRPNDWVWGSLDSLRLSFLVGLALLVPSLLTGYFPNVTHPLSIGMVMFVACALIAHTGAVDQNVSWIWVDTTTRMVIVSLLLITIVKERTRFYILLAVMAASLGLHSAKYGASFLLSGGASRFTIGIGGQFSDNNDFALAIVRVIFLLIAAAQLAPAKWIRTCFYISIPLSILAVIGTYSRGAFLGIVAGTFVFTALQRRRSLAVLLLAVFVTVGLWLAPIPDEYFERLQTIRTSEQSRDESAAGRLHFWSVARVMADRRWFGVGLKNFEFAYDQYDPSNGAWGYHKAVHSSHFQVMAELGYVGLTVWVGMILYALWACFRIRSRSKRSELSKEDQRFLFITSNALIASTVAFLVGGAFLSQALNDLNWLVFGTIACLDRLSSQMCTVRQSVGVGVVGVPPLSAAAGIRT